MNKTIICNNCSKIGHLIHQCKLPIISCGIILCQIIDDKTHYLMIRRKNSFGYIDFIYGKYNPSNIIQVRQKINEMSLEEKDKLLNTPFEDLWVQLRNQVNTSLQKFESNKSKKKFDTLVNGVLFQDKLVTLKDLVETSSTKWTETEWEFPKGRKNFQEKDLECALRECQEETGFQINNIQLIENILPYEEVFIGSNHKSYKHKYYIGITNINDISYENLSFQQSEVSKVEWKSYDDCLTCIRTYHLEKKQILKNVNETLIKNKLILLKD
jgi:8-oxo-dGTP pyrophosphatase MutT (NUDIX family)